MIKLFNRNGSQSSFWIYSIIVDNKAKFKKYLKKYNIESDEVHMITSHQGNHNLNKSYKEKVSGINVHYLYIPYDNSFGYLKRIIAFLKYISTDNHDYIIV